MAFVDHDLTVPSQGIRALQYSAAALIVFTDDATRPFEHCTFTLGRNSPCVDQANRHSLANCRGGSLDGLQKSAKGDQRLSVHRGGRVYGIDQWRQTFDRARVVETVLRSERARAANASGKPSNVPVNPPPERLADPPVIGFKVSARGNSTLTEGATGRRTITGHLRMPCWRG